MKLGMKTSRPADKFIRGTWQQESRKVSRQTAAGVSLQELWDDGVHSYAPTTALTLKCSRICMGHYRLKMWTSFCVSRFGRASIVSLFASCLAMALTDHTLHVDFVFVVVVARSQEMKVGLINSAVPLNLATFWLRQLLRLLTVRHSHSDKPWISFLVSKKTIFSPSNATNLLIKW